MCVIGLGPVSSAENVVNMSTACEEARRDVELRGQEFGVSQCSDSDRAALRSGTKLLFLSFFFRAQFPRQSKWKQFRFNRLSHA